MSRQYTVKRVGSHQILGRLIDSPSRHQHGYLRVTVMARGDCTMKVRKVASLARGGIGVDAEIHEAATQGNFLLITEQRTKCLERYL